MNSRTFFTGPWWFLLLMLVLPAFAWAQRATELRAVPSQPEVMVGERFTVTIEGAAPDAEIDWMETTKTISLIERNGAVSAYKAKAAGNAGIWATIRGQTVAAAVTVKSAPSKPNAPVPPPDAGEPPPSPAEPGHGGGSDDQKARQIIQILDEARGKLGSMVDQYGPAGNDSAVVKPSNPEALRQATEAFFRAMRARNLTLRDLQAFKERAKKAGALPTDSVLFPGKKSWADSYQGVERAVMAGRTEMVEAAWKQTLQEFYARHPDALVYGRIDIGSWVKNTLGGLGFESDVDFSSVSVDPQLNLEIKALFEQNLMARSGGLHMVAVDAILTAHGQATPDVFVGEWGKTFAELDMLKRSHWYVIEPERNPDGTVKVEDGRVVLKEPVKKPGSELFWQQALRTFERRQSAGLDPGDLDKIFPKMTLDMEPMLSMEMLRHGIHDIEHGPFQRGQKLIKMLKYVERSYFMNRKALAGSKWNPYEENNPKLASIADRLITTKGDKKISDAEKVKIYEDLIADLAGEDLNENNIDRVVDKVVATCKTAMIDNAMKGLAFRLVAIANLQEEGTRQAAVDKLWDNLSDEVAAFQESGVPVPDLLLQARELANQVRRGQLSFEEMEKKGQELHKLLEDAYKIPPPLIERILPFDIGVKISAALRKFNKMTDKAISEFIAKARTRPTKLNNLLVGIHELNEQMGKVTNGSKVMSALDTADTVLSLYEGWTAGRTKVEKAKNVTYILARVGVSSQNPLFGIPFGLYETVTSGSLMPAAMAVGFYFFPFAGQLAMISTHLERLDVALKDRAFFNALQSAMELVEFKDGKISAFKLKNFNGTVIHEETLNQPGNRDEIVEIMENPERLIATTRQFQYWRDLTPRLPTEYGMSRNAVRAQQWVQRWTGRDIFGYTQKLDRLHKFFGSNEEFLARLMMLKHHAKLENFPNDEFTPEREKLLVQMEDEIERAIWIAMADALESAVKSATLKPEWEKELAKLEEELNLRDSDLGKDNGLISKVKAAVAAAGSMITGENPYATGLIYEKYLNTYRSIAEIRNKIIQEFWAQKFGIDYVAAQSPPLKILLNGGKRAAPSLTADPDSDLALARACLGGQLSRAEKLYADLSDALEREVDAVKDKERVKKLAQWALEYEHLLDDCPERNAASGAPEIQAALRERSKAYLDFLDGLRKPKLEVVITGQAKTLPGIPSAFTATVKRPDGKPLPEMRTAWVASTQAAVLDVKGLSGSILSEVSGPVTVTLEIYQKMAPDEERLITSKSHRLEIEYPKAAFVLKGPESVKIDTEAAYAVVPECSAELKPALRVRWTLDGVASPVASELESKYRWPQVGKHRVAVEVLAMLGGKEYPLGGVYKDVEVGTEVSPPAPPVTAGTAAGEKPPVPVTPAATVPGFDPKKLNLNLRIVAKKTELRVGETAYLSASYSADNYIRERLKLVWNPDIGSKDYVKFTPEKPGVQKITLTALLPVKGVIVNVGEASVEMQVRPPCTVKAPAEVLATEFFEASIDIPVELKPKVAGIYWSAGFLFDESLKELPGRLGGYDPTSLTKLKVQIRPRPSGESVVVDGKPVGNKARVSASPLDAAGKHLEDAWTELVVKPALWSGTAPDVWQGGSHENGFSVRRKEAVRMRPDKSGAVKSGSAGGSLDVAWEYSAPKDMAELKSRVEGAAIWRMLPRGSSGEGKIAVEPLGFGDWKGYIMRTKQVITRYGGDPYGQYVDVSYPEARIAGYGMAMKGRIAVSVSYSAGGGGAALGEKKPWWDDMPFLMAQAAAADGEIQSMLGSLRVTADGKFVTTPYAGPKLDGSDLPQPLQLELKGPDKPLVPGRTAEISAVVTGGKTPYSYTWTGDHAGTGATVTFVASKPGDYKLAVTVTDAAGLSATKELVIKVAGMTGTVGGLGGKIYYGEIREVFGNLAKNQSGTVSGAKPGRKPLRPGYSYTPDGNIVNKEGREVNEIGMPLVMKPGEIFIPAPDEEDIFLMEPAPPPVKLIWQSSPNLPFDPPVSVIDYQNQALSDGFSNPINGSKVTFNRMPPEGVKIWAQIVQDVEGVPTTVGELDQVTVQVSGPEFTVVFDPAAGKVGQEIRATVKTTPPVKPELMNFEWDKPPSAERMEYNDPGTVIGFRLKNTAPYEIHANVRVPHDRDLIGEVRAVYTGTGYQVKAAVQEVGVRVKIYDPVTKSFKEPPRGVYCGDERIFLTARVIGEPPPEGVKWQWTVNEGTTISNDISQTPTVSRHETGTITATVVARDKNDVLLGQDTLNLPVSVPAAMVNPLVVNVTADQMKVKSGSKTWVRAAAQGGTSPYTYAWQGAKGSGSAVEVTGEKAGNQIVSLTVTDAKGGTATGEVTLIVEPITLAVRLAVDKPVHKLGESASLTATASGGVEPFVFTWAAPALGKAEKATWEFAKAGIEEASVAVTDKFGNKGAAVIKLTCEAATASIAGLLPKDLHDNARALSVTTDAPGPWEATFISEPPCGFAPATAADGRTVATFKTPGVIRVRAEVRRRGGNGMLLAKSPDYTVQVVDPQFSLSFDPAAGGVGESVVARLDIEPSEVRGEPFAVTWSGADGSPVGANRFTFVPGDIRPVSLTAAVRHAQTKQLLREARGTFAAKPVAMQVIAPGGTFVEGEAVEIKAGWPRGVQLPEAKFAWAVENGTISGANDKLTVSVKGTKPGRCKVTVNVRSAAGADIGTGSALLDIVAPPPSSPEPEAGSVVALTPEQLATAKLLGSIGNKSEMVSGARGAAAFSLTGSVVLTSLKTAHWNKGLGREPGRLALRKEDGAVFGPWKTAGRENEAGIKNFWWEATPNILLKPGTYTLIDSDPSTWSTNAEAENRGFFEAWGIAHPIQNTAPPPGKPAP